MAFCGGILYIDGESFHIDNSSSTSSESINILNILTRTNVISSHDLIQEMANENSTGLLIKLVQRGFFYPID